MRDRLSELGSETEVVLVTFTEPDRLDHYRTTNQLPFPILRDLDRAAYRAFGLGRGSLTRIYGWKAARRYFQLYRSGRLRGLRKPTEDTLQLGGDFVVGPDGMLTFGFWGRGPDDRPAVDELIDAINSGASGTNGSGVSGP